MILHAWRMGGDSRVLDESSNFCLITKGERNVRRTYRPKIVLPSSELELTASQTNFVIVVLLLMLPHDRPIKKHPREWIIVTASHFWAFRFCFWWVQTNFLKQHIKNTIDNWNRIFFLFPLNIGRCCFLLSSSPLSLIHELHWNGVFVRSTWCNFEERNRRRTISKNPNKNYGEQKRINSAWNEFGWHEEGPFWGWHFRLLRCFWLHFICKQSTSTTMPWWLTDSYRNLCIRTVVNLIASAVTIAPQ